MSPSRDHETINSRIGRVIDADLVHRRMHAIPNGEWTLSERGRRATRRVLLVRRGVRLQAETGPGARGREGESTSSRSIGAWRSRRFWEEGEILVYALHAGTDVRRERSQFLPDLDLTFVCSLLHLSVGAIHDAVRDRVSGG